MNILKKSNNLFISIVIVSVCIALIILILNKEDATSSNIPDSEYILNVPLHPAVKEYLDLLAALLDSANNVGAAITIVNKDQVLLLKTFGVKKAGSNDSIDSHTVFRLASVSKGFTGVLACILEKEGILSLQDKVVNFLPSFRLKDSINTYELNIEHLLNHASGLVPHAYDNLIEDGLPLHRILNHLSEVNISAPPGVLYGYQNVLFSLIDTIAYIETGMSYKKLMEKKVFKPLQMRNASVGPKIFTRRNANIAYPHGRNDSSYFLIQVNLGYYNISPAAGVNASISDLSIWLQALLGHNPDVLDSIILDKIAEPLIETPLKYRYIRYWDNIESKHYSLGWRIYQYKNRKIVYHGGFVRGYRAEIAFCPDENIGIAFLQNSPNRVASMSIPAFFNIYFNYLNSSSRDSVTWNTFFNGFDLPKDTLDNYNY